MSTTPEPFSILLVDDDPMAIRVLSRILEGFTPVRFATSGRAALKLARESVPDLVLLDLEMPDMSGLEVCRSFKRDPVLSEVPIILVTSHDSTQLEAAGLQLGAVDFIVKPPHAPLVLARVRTHQRIKLLSDTVRSAVTIDFITGAVTRRRLEDTLAQEWLRGQRSGASLAFLFAQIDDFGSYNAALGDEKGEDCLRAVADAIRAATQRPGDLLGRYYGGKFGLLLPQTDAKGASVVANRAIEAVDALKLQHPTTGRMLTLSVGGAWPGAVPDVIERVAIRGEPRVPTEGLVENLLVAAEHALRSVSSTGGHRAVLFDASTAGAMQTFASPGHLAQTS